MDFIKDFNFFFVDDYDSLLACCVTVIPADDHSLTSKQLYVSEQIPTSC